MELTCRLFQALPRGSKMVAAVPGIKSGRTTPYIYRASLPMCFFIRKDKDFPLYLIGQNFFTYFFLKQLL